MVASYSAVTTVPKQKESQLLASFFAGNQQAYWQLWILYDRQIYGYCLTLMGNNIEDAEDAKQEIMCKGFWKLSQYKQCLTSLKNLLLIMARHTCRDLLRQKKMRQWLALKEAEFSPNQPDSPETTVIRREQRNTLESAIAHLPPCQRYVISRYYLQGIPHAIIAQHLKIKPATSRKHAEKGIKKLRKLLLVSSEQ
jgi:RNA polymerase sigma factor (sigma-70 family)